MQAPLNKPTMEELDAQIEEAAALPTEIEEKKKELEENTHEETDTDEHSEQDIEEKEQVKPVETEVDESSTDEEVKEEVPEYKKKFIESSRESQVLSAKIKKQNESIEEALQTPPPTEEELQKEFPEWDVMTPLEKRMAKESVHNSRRFAALDNIAKENKNIQQWQGKVEEFVTDPKSLIKHPLLEGKEDEFRLFATKPTRRGVEFDDLVSAFLYEERESRPKNKAKTFPRSTAGEKRKPNDGKLSIEDSARLRETNYPEYRRMLLAGKIADQV